MAGAPFPRIHGPLSEARVEIADMVLDTDLWPHVPRVMTDEDYLAMIEPSES
jgi:hypothetical protein